MSINKCLKLFSKIVISQPAGYKLQRLGVYKCYSQYSPAWEQAVYLPEKQEEILKIKTEEEIKSARIKAATSHDTCSAFYDPELRDFIDFFTRKGDRKLARSLVEEAFAEVKRIQLKKYRAESNEEEKAKIVIHPYKIFHAAIKNCRPIMETTLVVRGGIRYQVPVPIRPDRAKFLSYRYLVEGALEKPKSERFYIHLAQVLVEAAENKGKAVERKLRLHKLCEENRAYAHYRWT